MNIANNKPEVPVPKTPERQPDIPERPSVPEKPTITPPLDPPPEKPLEVPKKVESVWN